MRSTTEDLPDVHRLLVTIPGVRPATWRRLLVPSTYSLADLHGLLQAAFGPNPADRHEFDVDGTRYGPGPAGSGGPPVAGLRDEAGAVLSRIAPRAGAQFSYEPGPAAPRPLRIEVEAVSPADPDQLYPACLDGRGGAHFPGPDGPVPGDRNPVDVLDRALRRNRPGRAGRELPRHPSTEALLAGAFPDTPRGEQAAASLLRPYSPLPAADLATIAAGSEMVCRAVQLARWVGPGRSLTHKHLLSPADAVAVWAELEPQTTVSKVASARQIPRLHALWWAAVDAGLIEIRGERAVSGPAVAIWSGDDAGAQLENWTRLLAGYLRARSETVTATPEFSRDDVVVAAAQMYYSMARDPIPAALPALAVVMGEELRSASLFVAFGLPEAIETAAQDWVTAGVLAEVDEGAADRSDDVVLARELIDGLISAVDDPAADPSAFLLRPVVDRVRVSPLVELTALGSYGLWRVLAAQGFTAPVIGDLSDVPPDEFLERLVPYDAPDAFVEAAAWIEAHDDEQSLLQVALSARVEDRETGPFRRSVLQLVLAAGGARTEPVLRALADEPWLRSVAATVGHLLGTGPEPSLDDELWLAVDSLSSVVDGDDDEQAEIIHGSRILDLLGRSGGLAAAVALTHPHTRACLQMVSEQVDDPELAGQLRFAIGRRPPGRRNPARPPNDKVRRPR